MTTRRNSGEGFGSMHPEERRGFASRDERTSQRRFENDYDTDFGNGRKYYDDSRDSRFEAGDRTRKERHINDDEDYDNGNSGRYGRSERRYNSEYGGGGFEDDRYDKDYRGQDQRSHRDQGQRSSGRYSEESRNDNNRFFDENHKSLFNIQHVTQTQLLLDKTDFMHSGWFYFELYENDRLKERNKFYIPKDF